MSLTYGGTTYRNLEEQVRKNMEDISTEAESLAALTDKVDNLQTGGTKVSLTFPAGASSGTVTAEQLAKLQENDANYIEMVNDKELYYLNDPGHVEGYLTYSHVGIENSKATIKTLTITVSAKSFVIITTVVPTESGGGKLYSHYIELTHSVYGKSWIVFLSSRETAYTFSDLVEYIKTFDSGKFITLTRVKDKPYDYLYDALVEAPASNYIEIWYTITYGNDFTSSKQATSLISDTVTEV